MNRPCLSVVIPVYNGRDHLAAALESLIDQTRRDFEIIVVDDGSTDDVGDLVQKIAAGLDPSGPAISLIRQDNAGVSAARNRGIAAARAEFVGFLDADDLWAPEKVARHLSLMSAQPSIELSFSGFDIIDAAGRNLFEGLTPHKGGLSLDTLMVRNVIHTSTVIARREALAACGGFDTGLSNYEDFDLWLRIAARRPGNIYGITEALACYRRHAAQTTKDWRKMHEGWLRVTSAVAARHPEKWAEVRRKAFIYHSEYCASLAYNGGDIARTRALVAAIWKKAGPSILLHKNALIMTGVCVASYLPVWLQAIISRSVFMFRKTSHRLKTARRPANQVSLQS